MKEKNIIDELKSLLATVCECGPVEVSPMGQSGSTRLYYRLCADGLSYIGTYVSDPVEGECFVSLARAFRSAGRCVPDVLAVSECGRFYIQEDLGDASLFSLLKSEGLDDMVKFTLKRLIDLQTTPADIWMDKCMCRPLGVRQIMWDLNYFKYEYLKPQETLFDEDRLENDFERLASRIASIPDEFIGFMMRDCQSRNVIMTDSGPYFIDFQGGRRGPVLYDSVSLLWQARAGFDDGFRRRMLEFYCNEFCARDEERKERMMAYADDLVLFRTLQVLGAYGFRGIIQRKTHFLLSIPGALENLRTLAERGVLDEYPELKRCAAALTAELHKTEEQKNGVLTVEVFSFSYKKGYPEDRSGNGGGFMFDCRAIHNPGRYKEYRHLTGRDRPVVDFLEARGEVQSFLKKTWSLTDPAIERYLSRGFTNLQIGFGCTGGQHRSVYCAEYTAAHIRLMFPEIKVHLIHREHPAL